MDTNMLNKGKKRDEIIDYYFENNMFYNRTKTKELNMLSCYLYFC